MKKLVLLLLLISALSFSQTEVSIMLTPDFVYHEGQTHAVLKVYRDSGDTTTALTVNFSVTPTNEVDLVSGSVVLPANEVTTSIIINPQNAPAAPSADRQVVITLDSGTGYTIGDGSETLYIKDELPIPSFVGAEGAGAIATGGRGGIVRHVTSLADDGSVGTLRWAITTASASPVTVVFDVSGTINTGASSLNVNIDNLTIAGQTAPEGGITIQGKWFGFYQAENLIARYFRVVNTDFFVSSDKSATINGSGSNSCIFDHVSMRYAWITPAMTVQDNNDRDNGSGNFTMQRCILSDNHTGGIVGSSAFPEDRGAYGGQFSVHHNYYVHIDHRFPNVSGASEVEIVENVIYNYRARLSTFFNNSKSNLINNTYKAGSASIFTKGGFNKIGEYVEGNPSVYSSGNRRIDSFGNLEPTNTNWGDLFVIWRSGSDQISPVTPQDEALYRQTTEFPSLGRPITRLGTDAAFTSVLSDVGANKYLNADGTYGIYLDENDAAYISDATNDTCYSCQPSGDLPDKTDANQLNYPVLPNNTRPANYYVSNPHIPEAYLDSRLSDLQAEGVAKTDTDVHNHIMPSGRTLLEEFIGEVDEPAVNIPATSVTVSPENLTLAINETFQLTRTVNGTSSNASNQSGTWTSTYPSIATVSSSGFITAVAEGSTIVTFTSNDGNFTDTSNITVTATVTYPPTNPVSSNVTQTTATISWDAVAEAASYDVTINGVTSNVTGGTTYNATGLTAGTTYPVTIISKNGSDENIGSVQFNVTTLSVTVPTPSLGGASRKSILKTIMQ